MKDTIRLDNGPDGIATLTLARADRHNAMDAAMIEALTRVAARIAGDSTIRAVILTGEGRSFCAGADLNWMKAQFKATREQRIDQARALATMLKAFNELSKPLVGRINGQAFGGGVGLISVCDVAIADERARFAFTETKLGLVPATIAPYVHAKMGEGAARRVFMSARTFDAQEAVRLGLLAKAVPADDLDHAVAAEVAPYLQCSPKAVAAAKALSRSLGPPIDARVIEATAKALADTWETPDAIEGVSAFFEKRKASFAAM